MFNKNSRSKKDNAQGSEMNLRPSKKGARQGSSKPLVVLDIGSKTTKLVSGRFRGNRITLEGFNGTVNTKEVTADGKISNLPEAERIIKELVKKSHSSLHDLVFTVDTTGLIRREITIPYVSEEYVLGAVTYQMGDYLPIDINSYVLQVKEIGVFSENGHKRRRMSVAALPKEVTETYLTLCEKLNISMNSLDVNSNAVEKLLSLEIKTNPGSPFKGKNVVFIDMGHSYFNVSIYSNGKYLFNKIIAVGGKMVDKVIAARMHIPEKEAEVKKIANGSKYSVIDLMHRFSNDPNVENNFEALVLRDSLVIYEKWVSEVNKILNYFTTRDRANKIDEVYLYGGCSFINGIDEYFERRLQLPTKTFANFGSIELSSGEVNRNILNYLNVTGALIRG